MKLIVIYGPPAVGKFTVAKELTRLTRFRLFHNHLTVDLLESVIDTHNKKFWKLVDAYRLELIELAAEEKVKGLIFTCVHVKGDETFFRDLTKVFKKHKGSIYFIRLYCDLDKLRKRLKEPSRKQYRKLKTLKRFNEFVSENDVFSPISFVKSLEIDNSNISAKRVAKMIKEYYKV